MSNPRMMGRLTRGDLSGDKRQDNQVHTSRSQLLRRM